MNEPWRSGRSNPIRRGGEPTDPLPRRFPAPAGTALNNQLPYPPSASSSPTEQLPQYWQQAGSPPAGEPPSQPPRPGRFKSPRWLWIAAAAAVVLAVALVVALVIANISAKKPTMVPPLPAVPESSPKTPGATSSSPGNTSASSAPSSTATNGADAMQAVVYDVTGDGHAISITYVDTGGVRETEFNVVLPWSKEVSLAASGQDSASVTVVNIGHNVTCSVTVAGVQVRQHTGVGVTVCNAAS